MGWNQCPLSVKSWPQTVKILMGQNLKIHMGRVEEPNLWPIGILTFGSLSMLTFQFWAHRYFDIWAHRHVPLSAETISSQTYPGQSVGIAICLWFYEHEKDVGRPLTKKWLSKRSLLPLQHVREQRLPLKEARIVAISIDRLRVASN